MSKYKLKIKAISAVKLFIILSIVIIINPLSADEQINQGSILYKKACYVCHDSGLVNAPGLGDKVAWEARKKRGIGTLTQTVISGKGAMLPRGGTLYTDAQINQVVRFMLSKVK